MKVLAIVGGLIMGALLTIIGFGMSAADDGTAYGAPVKAGVFSLICLPLGYWLGAARLLKPWAGATACAIMLVIAIGLWVPLITDATLRNAHVLVLAIWTALWWAASLPFARQAVRAIRTMRKRN